MSVCRICQGGQLFFFGGGGGLQRVACQAFAKGVRGHASPQKISLMVKFGGFWSIF